MSTTVIGRNKKIVVLKGSVSDTLIKQFESLGLKVIILFGEGIAK